MKEFLRSDSFDRRWKLVAKGVHPEARLEWENALSDAVQRTTSFSDEDVDALGGMLTESFARILNRTVAHREGESATKGSWKGRFVLSASMLLFAACMLFLFFGWINSIPLAICDIVR